jgi:hypothetical protein
MSRDAGDIDLSGEQVKPVYCRMFFGGFGMKRLTIMAAVMLATLLIVRPPLYAQNDNGNPDMGGAANDSGQDNSDQQVAPDQQPGGDEAGDQNTDQNNDPNAAADQNDQNDDMGQNDQTDQNDNQGDTGADNGANTANQ